MLLIVARHPALWGSGLFRGITIYPLSGPQRKRERELEREKERNIERERDLTAFVGVHVHHRASELHFYYIQMTVDEFDSLES